MHAVFLPLLGSIGFNGGQRFAFAAHVLLGDVVHGVSCLIKRTVACHGFTGVEIAATTEKTDQEKRNDSVQKSVS